MYVLKDFKFDESAETFLSIKGRKAGFWAFLLTLIGLDPIVELKGTRNEVLFKATSLKGQNRLSIPVNAISCVGTGYTKPLAMLVIAGIAVLLGIILGFSAMADSEVGIGFVWLFVGLIVAAVFFFLYKVKKNISFFVMTGGNKAVAGLTTRGSVIEGVNVDFDKFEAAAILLNKVVYTAKSTMSVTAVRTAPASSQTVAV